MISRAKRTQRRTKLPTIKQPMLATSVDEPFDDEDWLFELKWDGVRAICTAREDGAPVLTSRTGHSLVEKFPELARIGDEFRRRPVIVDGEIVSLDAKGHSSFQRLQRRFQPARGKNAGTGIIAYAAFDLLFDGSEDLRARPLEERKARLERCIRAGAQRVLYSKHVVEKGIDLYRNAARQSLEGIIGKRRNSTYQERRSRDWVKIKVQSEQEFVVGGWTDPKGSRAEFGALLLGVYEGNELRFAGHVGTGFDGATLSTVMARMRPLASSVCPFADAPREIKKSHWLKPKLVAQVRFGEWTADGLLRQPVFLGLREDKRPKDVVRER